MMAFRGIVRYEFRMQVRRKALWIALPIPLVLLLLPELLNRPEERASLSRALLSFVATIQLFMPIVAGFFLSDRLYRDLQLTTAEWVDINGASRRQYLWGKYVGAVAATLLAALVYWMISAALEYAAGLVDAVFIGYALIAFVLAVVPSYLFVGAYCVAVPSGMSLRLYQILFTCYWMWAHQQVVPSVSGTPLLPNGQLALQALLRGMGANLWADGWFMQGPFGWTFEVTPAMAALNVGLLLLLAVIALLAGERYLNWKQERA